MPRLLTLSSVLLACLLGLPPAAAGDLSTYLLEPGGKVREVRVFDLDGDGRRDVIAIVHTPAGAEQVLVLRTPETPVRRRLFPEDHVVRIALDGTLAQAGALAVGRFGPKGEGRLRFLAPDGLHDLLPDGTPTARTAREQAGTPLARSAGRPLVFWDGVADLDGDGLDEIWFPCAEGDGPMRIRAGTPAGDRVLSITATNQGASSGLRLLERHAYVPNLFPADLDGDGRRELVALRDGALVAWDVTGPAPASGPLAPATRLPLPFLDPDPDLGPEDLRTPRIQLEDVDGDGVTDLLVTLITGVRSKLTSIRTIFFHYPGPFRDPETGTLVAPRTRIDTQSIVLHPTFVDIDSDGDRDYVGDSIRGTMMDMIARMMGRDPEITLVGFRFDKTAGTFESTPAFTVQRSYASQQALGNLFGRSAWLDGDFDGDGHKDLLDLGNLTGVEILVGAEHDRGLGFEAALLPRVPVPDGLSAGAQIADLDGDGRADAVLWSATKLYFVMSRGGPR